MHRSIPVVVSAVLALAASGFAAPAEAQTPICAYHQVGCVPETGDLPGFGTPVGTHGTSRVYIADDRVRIVDLETLELRDIPLEPFVHLWDSLTMPQRSVGIGGPGPSAWIWDGSGGTPMRLPLRDGERAQAYPRRSWYALFGHAPGIHPETGNPLMYGGYGFYRAMDYLLEFDPEGDTWRELPVHYGTEGPGPRNAAWLVTGWDPRRILLVGGAVAQPGQTPPVYTRETGDAWVYNPADSTWTELDADPGLVCSLKQWVYTKVSIATDPRTGSIVFPMLCPTTEYPDRAVLQWRPVAGTVDVLGIVPRDLALQKVPVGTYIVPGSDSVTVMFWRTARGRLPAEWTASRFRFRMRTDYDPAPASGREGDGPRWPWLLGLSAAALAAALALVRRRRSATLGPAEDLAALGPVLVTGTTNGPVRLVAGRTDSAHELSLHARELLDFVARRGLDAGHVLDADEINDLFLSHYRDADTARVTKNRALDQLNEAFRGSLGRPLLERRRSPADRRRVEYVVTFTLRPGGDQPA